ncbi:dihydrofolate reductase [Thalassospira profundimaris]|uniref:Dihydrofolate reductase n=1 Tax=Thalassospira profundimaris TaxID=502049 RepID=A0A367WR89_9PROT|nr:D-glycerate dehydrogenase [Thalassospira profundimaris]RCK43887.1 dihydrofolate reductase [Thalassospira profundimaris]
MKPVLAITRRLPADIEARAHASYDVRLNEGDTPLDRDAILALANGADALLVSVGDPIDAAFFDALPKSVKIIATFSVGTDHIDLAAAARKGIVIGNTPGVLTDATADIAWLLMLGAARRVSEGEAEIRTASWRGWRPTHLIGTQVTGKKLGIIGMGRIGQAVAKRARGFDMEVHYYNRKRLPADQEYGATYHDSIDDLLPHCQFLSLHCPSTAETRGMVNTDLLAKLPKGAILVNTARGDVVKDSDVIAALKSGQLAAAGLDVFAGEPNIAPGYRDLPNTFLLPHLGSATAETRTAMGSRALDNIDACLAGKDVPFAVKTN